MNGFFLTVNKYFVIDTQTGDESKENIGHCFGGIPGITGDLLPSVLWSCVTSHIITTKMAADLPGIKAKITET